jgi:GNAT superfamily N-acetyltransferase
VPASGRGATGLTFEIACATFPQHHDGVSPMSLEIVTLRRRPDLRAAIFADEIQLPAFPEFMRHDRVADLYYTPRCLDRYLDFVLVGLDGGKVVARAFSVPFAFDIEGRTQLPDAGWDEVIRWAHEDHLAGRTPNAVSALDIALLPAARGAGHSRAMLQALKANAGVLGFSDLYAPLRPNEKHRQPHVPMAEYLKQVRADGLPADAWLRTHLRAGGRIVKIAPCSMTIVGTVADWSRWTAMTFSASGSFTVEGALAPVTISLEHDHGVYVEPNVWMHHAT